jgi:hypothetical protein
MCQSMAVLLCEVVQRGTMVQVVIERQQHLQGNELAIFLGPTLLAIGYTAVRDWALAVPVTAAATPDLEQG